MYFRFSCRRARVVAADRVGRRLPPRSISDNLHRLPKKPQVDRLVERSLARPRRKAVRAREQRVDSKLYALRRSRSARRIIYEPP